MTTDHLTPEQKAEAPLFFGDGSGWGFGVGVSVLLVRGLMLLGREPAEASAVGKGGRGVGCSTCSC
jgi:hypothetical protein